MEIFLLVVILCMISILGCSVVIIILRVIESSRLRSVPRQEPNRIHIMAAAVLENRVSDSPLSIPTSNDAEPLLNRSVSAQGGQQEEQLTTAESIVEEAQQDSHESLASSRSASARTTRSERRVSPHHSVHSVENGTTPGHNVERDTDNRTPEALPNGDDTSTITSNNRSRGAGQPYPMALNLVPLGVINLTASADPAHNTNGEVRPVASLQLHYARDQRLHTTGHRLGILEMSRDTLGNPLWRRLRRHHSSTSGPVPQNDYSNPLIVADGYCCDARGNQIRDEAMGDVYGQAQYISRTFEGAVSAEGASKQSNQEEDVTIFVMGDSDVQDTDNESEKRPTTTTPAHRFDVERVRRG